jgi:hypothetical protein
VVTFLTPLASILDYAKGSLGHTFVSRIHTENPSQVSFCPYALREISVLAELTLGHLCYRLTDVPPQPNSPPDTVFSAGRSPVQAQVTLLSARRSLTRKQGHPTLPNK